MSDKKEEGAAAPKKKGKLPKLLAMIGALVVLVGGGVAAGVYAAGAGLVGGGHAAAEEKPGPKLVPKSEQKHAGTEGAEGGEHGGGEAAEGGEGEHGGGEGGDKYASNYFKLDKDFTANLADSVHVIQIGLAVSTPYDDKVIQNLQTNEIAVRSAVLLALGDTPEEEVFSSAGKKKLATRLVAAMNDTLKQKEGFGGVGNVYFTSFVVQ